jgi:hypothetical protein
MHPASGDAGRIAIRFDAAWGAEATMNWHPRIIVDRLVCHGRVCAIDTRVMASVVMDDIARVEKALPPFKDALLVTRSPRDLAHEKDVHR